MTEPICWVITPNGLLEPIYDVLALDTALNEGCIVSEHTIDPPPYDYNNEKTQDEFEK